MYLCEADNIQHDQVWPSSVMFNQWYQQHRNSDLILGLVLAECQYHNGAKCNENGQHSGKAKPC